VTAYSRLERLAARWCHRLVTVSRFHRDWAIQLGIAPAERIIAIPNGIAEAPQVAPERVAALRAEFGATPGTLLLVSAGRLAPGKGLDELLTAVARLGERPWRLVLPGAGPLSGSLSDQCRRLGLTDRVVLPGFRDDVRDILAASDLAVLPTHREGLSIALLEAMAASLPVITTTIGSNREVSHEGAGALLVTPGDVAGLAAAIDALLADADRRGQLAARGAAIVQSDYTEQRMLEAYLDLYGSLAAGS
jgi:glycosyltransferase involved in cell wall biosynthesis